MNEMQEYAKEMIEETWQKFVNEYTVGFTNIIGVQESYSFVYDRLNDIKDDLILEFPVILYQTRQSPPEDMVAAIPYQLAPDPLSCRLVSSNALEDIDSLSEFARAIWVLVGTEGLPHPFLKYESFEKQLINWTDEKLYRL